LLDAKIGGKPHLLNIARGAADPPPTFQMKKLFVLAAVNAAAEIHIAPGAIAADCPKGLFVLKRGTEKSPDSFVVTPLTAA